MDAMTPAEALKKREWTQRMLAEETGLTPQKISLTMQGLPLCLRDAEKIATALDFDTDLHEMVSGSDAQRMKAWADRQRKVKKEGGK